MKLGWQPRKWLEKKTKQGFRGYPVGTVAFYGPDDRRATKVVASIVLAEDSDPVAMRKWFAESGDVRESGTIFTEIAMFLRGHEPHSVAMPEQIVGCPHEEGIDYPADGVCPHCSFWTNRDRWAGVFGAKR